MVNALDKRMQAAALPEMAKPLEKETPPADVAKWDLSRFASTRGSTDNSESSIPPAWIPTNPPMLLAARYGGALVAFNAAEPGTGALWQFTPAGTIYGPPAFDARAAASTSAPQTSGSTRSMCGGCFSGASDGR
jgi:hypothetical protein